MRSPVPMRALRRRAATGAAVVATVLASAPLASAAVSSTPSIPSTPSTRTTGWHVEPTAMVAGKPAPQFSAVACTSRSSCTAVGTVGAVSFAERWNGRTWGKAVRIRVAGVSATLLEAVACSSATDCVAVGAVTIGDRSEPLIEHWNGRTWRRQRIAGPRSMDASLSSVSCSGAAACTAVGLSSRGSTETALIERWNGSTWARQAPAAAPTGVDLASVACPAARFCVAVGATEYRAGKISPVLEAWNGRSWRRQTSPKVAGAHTVILLGVSCSSRTACTAVGSWSPSSAASGTHPLVERFNGRTWVRQSITVPPAEAGTTTLDAVSCPSRRHCTAVGSFGPNMGFQPAVEGWTGKTWKAEKAPRVGTASDLTSVSCEVGSCQAVGPAFRSTATKRRHPLAEGN